MLLVRCRAVLPLNNPNTPLLILGDKCIALRSWPGWIQDTRRKKQRDVMTALAVALMLGVIVLALVRRENDVVNSDEEEPLGVLALGNEGSQQYPQLEA